MAVKRSYTNHAIAFPTKVLAAEGGEHILNVVLDKDRDNGEMVEIDECNGLDNYSIKDTTSATGEVIHIADNGMAMIEITSTAEVVFIYMDPINPYAATRADKNDHYFYNEKGDVVKGYILHKRDVVSTSIENFTGYTELPAVGTKLKTAGGKWVAAA